HAQIAGVGPAGAARALRRAQPRRRRAPGDRAQPVGRGRVAARQDSRARLRHAGGEADGGVPADALAGGQSAHAGGRRSLLAPAARSSGGTTDITYDWRAGTSMLERLMRRSSSVTAAVTLGTMPASSRNRLAGRCVYTMVSMRPMRAASRDETNCENAPHSP